MKKPSPELVHEFMEWFKADVHSEYEDYYLNQINFNSLSKLTREDLIEFFYNFACDGGKVQTGGHRTANLFKKTIESKYNDFREYILEPFDTDFDVFSWLDRNGDFSGFGMGLATIYLNRLDKNRFVIVNNKAIEAMKLFNIFFPSTLKKRYEILLNAERKLISWYPDFENLYRTDAFTHFLIGVDAGRKWKEVLTESEVPNDFKGRYWIYAPGEKAKKWEEYFQEGIMGVGWNEIEVDLSGYNETELKSVYENACKEKATKIDFKQLYNFVIKAQKGDRVFVKNGIKKFVGFGEITSDYFYDSKKDDYRHQRKANWIKNGEWVIPEGEKNLPQKTLTELKDKSKIKKFCDLIQVDCNSYNSNPENPITNREYSFI